MKIFLDFLNINLNLLKLEKNNDYFLKSTLKEK